ncbi:MAG: holo-ACP synthase [Syntrophales bacterium]|nr:holo-ACP synthase [Syntrophales bacterium]
MIYGIGIDFVEVSRMEKILKRWEERFTNRVYSPLEIDYCKKRAFPAMHYAARFAVKESFLKAAGVGLWMGIRLKDIEILNNREGRPEIKLHEKAKEIPQDNGITAIYISLSHTAVLAVAMVILER